LQTSKAIFSPVWHRLRVLLLKGEIMKKSVLGAAIAALSPVLCSGFASGATIASLYPTGSGSASYTATVISILNAGATTTSFVVSDGTGSALLYNAPKTTYTPSVGDNISFTATDSPYQGAPELTTLSSVTVNSSANAVAPVVLTVSQFDATGNGAVAFAPLGEALVELDNVYFPATPSALATNTTYTISDAAGNEAHLYAYKSDSAVGASVAGYAAGNGAGYYDIVGYNDEYYGAPEIYPVSITAVPEPLSIGAMGLGVMGLLRRRRRV
jgi:hypothetical protein